jgi:hypothetical protein
LQSLPVHRSVLAALTQRFGFDIYSIDCSRY